MALASRAPSFRPQKHRRVRPPAIFRNVQQILVVKGDLRLQVLAKFLQNSLTQKIGIEFAGFCKLDNSFGDSFIDKIALVANLKSCASHFECYAHDPLGLGIEFAIVQKLRDGHDLSPLSAMELGALSAGQSGDGLLKVLTASKNQNG
jgi:hypothetical protein